MTTTQTGEKMEKWKTDFENHAKQRIREKTLEYFRKTYDNPALQHDSTVFNKPTMTPQDNFNRLAVKVFLSHIWDFIKEVVPTAPNFINVLADANFLLFVKYPYICARTHTIHGIETVRDFSGFAEELILHTCMPTNTENRTNGEQGESKSKSSAHFGEDDFRTKDHYKELLKIVDPEAVVNQEEFLSPSNHRNVRATAVQKLIEDRYAITSNYHQHVPASPAFVGGERTIRKITDDGKTFPVSYAHGLVAGIVEETTPATIVSTVNDEKEGSEIEVLYVLQGKLDMQLSERELAELSEHLNGVAGKIVGDQSLQVISDQVNSVMYQRVPMDFCLHGELKDGKYQNIFCVFAVGNQISVADLSAMTRLMSQDRTVNKSRAKGFQVSISEEGALPQAIDAPQMSTRSLIEQARQFLGPNEIDFLEIATPAQLETQAMYVIEGVFGNAQAPTSPDNVLGALFIPNSDVENNEGLETDIIEMYASVVAGRRKMLAVNESDRLEQVVEEVNAWHEHCLEAMAKNEMREEKSPTDVLMMKVHDTVASMFGEPFRVELDLANLGTEGYGIWQLHRDSKNPEKRAKAAGAISKVIEKYEDNSWKTTMLALGMRNLHHTNNKGWLYRNAPMLGIFGIFLQTSEINYLPEDKDARTLFFENYEALMSKPEAARVYEMDVKACNGMSADVAGVLHDQSGSGKILGIDEFSQRIVVWTTVYCLCAGLIHWVSSKLKSRHPNQMNEQRYIDITKHMIILISGLVVHLPIATIYLIMICSADAVARAFIGGGRNAEVFALSTAKYFMSFFTTKQKGTGPEPKPSSKKKKQVARLINWGNRPRRYTEPIQRYGENKED